MKESGSCR